MTNANEFYTLATLMTLLGASGATLVITNGLKSALSFGSPWIGLLVSFIVTLTPVFLLTTEGSQGFATTLFVGICNSFLVYATAGGTNEAIRGNTRAGEDRNIRNPRHNGFFRPWFSSKT
jgi:hypothetical protein